MANRRLLKFFIICFIIFILAVWGHSTAIGRRYLRHAYKATKALSIWKMARITESLGLVFLGDIWDLISQILLGWITIKRSLLLLLHEAFLFLFIIKLCLPFLSLHEIHLPWRVDIKWINFNLRRICKVIFNKIINRLLFSLRWMRSSWLSGKRFFLGWWMIAFQLGSSHIWLLWMSVWRLRI